MAAEQPELMLAAGLSAWQCRCSMWCHSTASPCVLFSWQPCCASDRTGPHSQQHLSMYMLFICSRLEVPNTLSQPVGVCDKVWKASVNQLEKHIPKHFKQKFPQTKLEQFAPNSHLCFCFEFLLSLWRPDSWSRRLPPSWKHGRLVTTKWTN